MRFAILSFICAAFMVSCVADETDEYTVGGDFVDNNVEIKVIDTFTINTSTFKLDSIITSSTSRILIGNVNDSYLGKVTAQSYLQVNNSSYDIDNEAVYDSIGFVLNYDGYYYGDTLKPQTYKIHRIKETFEPKDDATDFYNTSFLDFEKDESLGQVTFIPRPNRDADSVYIQMQHSLGEDIFNEIVDNEINNSDDFLQYFKGLTIISDDLSNSHVLGFNAFTTEGAQNNSSMRLYYTVPDEDNEGVSNYIEFVISSIDKQFNAIKTNISNTEISDLSVDDSEIIIPSSEIDDLMYVQAGTGVSARINIPSIKKLKETAEIVTSLGTELRFKPLKGTYNEHNSLKDSLAVYVIDHKNRILNFLTNEIGSTAYAILNQSDDEFDSNTYYNVDLSGYVEEILTTEEDLNYSLMIQYTDFNKSVNRVIIENPENEEDRVKLTVKYLNY